MNLEDLHTPSEPQAPEPLLVPEKLSRFDWLKKLPRPVLIIGSIAGIGIITGSVYAADARYHFITKEETPPTVAVVAPIEATPVPVATTDTATATTTAPVTTAPSTPAKSTASPAAPAATTVSVKTVSSSEALEKKSAGRCQALAPAGWSLTPNADGTSTDMQSSDKQLYAGWIIVGINRAMQPYYGDFYGEPADSAKSIANTVIGAKFSDTGGITSFTTKSSSNGFTQYEYTSGKTHGYLYGMVWPVNDSQYIESVYMAATTSGQWSANKDTVVAAAASIQCVSQVRPSSTVSGASSTASSSTGNDGLASSDYNSQLGIDYVHSPSTGENYSVDYASQYNANGPDGAGYYRSTGSNSYEKLDSGWQY